jgi:fumarate hydratase subunit alpha
MPLCQDTGVPIIFLEIGQDVSLSGIDVTKAVQQGVALGYRQGYLRSSIVGDPFRRGEGSDFAPGILHAEFVPKRGLTISVLPKGFGCENKTQLKMFNPTASSAEVVDFIIHVVCQAGCDACPPYVVGVGIGGTADHAALLSKKALLRPVNCRSRVPMVARMERDLISRMNRMSIGPLGLGGSPTVLGVNIVTAPTHIAGLPVCVNISCHALRSAAKRLC